jgi:hypothetical protein
LFPETLVESTEINKAVLLIRKYANLSNYKINRNQIEEFDHDQFKNKLLSVIKDLLNNS